MTTVVRLTSGQDPNGGLDLDGISSDGRYVLYGDESPTGIEQAINEYILLDTQTGVKQTVAINTDNTGGNIEIFETFLSSDGRYVAYDSLRADPSNSNNDISEISVFDRVTGDTSVVFSKSFPGLGGSVRTTTLVDAISPDGQTVFFSSDFPDLTGVPDDGSHPDVFDLFEVNAQTGAIQRILVAFDNFTSPPGTGKYLTAIAGDDVTGKSLYRIDTTTGNVDAIVTGAPLSPFERVTSSDDGRFVSFETDQALVSGDTDGATDVYVKDLSTGEVKIVSTSSTGVVIGGTQSTISADGTKVLFVTAASGLVPGGTGTLLVSKDLATGALSILANATVMNSYSLSADGSTLTLNTDAVLTADDTNTTADVYLIHFTPPALTVHPISSDDIVNATESIVTVSGTSDAINQAVLVTLPDEPGVSATAVVQANGTWSTTINIGGLAEGATHVDVSVGDGLTTRVAIPLTIDRTAPSLTLLSVADDNIVNAAEASSIDIEGTAFDNSTDFTGKLVQLSIDHVAIGTAQVLANGDWSFHYDGHSLTDGQHEIEFSVADTAGNVKSRSIFFDVDQTPPKISITSIGGDNVVNTTEARNGAPVVGTSDAIGATVNVLIGDTVVGSGVVQANGTWTADIHPDGTSGRASVTAEVADEAGNQSSAVQFGWFDSDIIRVSTKSDGSQGDVDPDSDFPPYYNASLSGDGRYVAFQGDGGLVSGDATDYSDVYVKDVKTGVVTLVTKPTNASSLDGYGDVPVISQDGSTVAYFGQTGGADHIFVADWVNGIISSANTTSTGTLSNGHVLAEQPGISADGRYVAFISDATNLATNATSGTFQVYRKDMNSGAIQLVSEASGVAMAGDSDNVSISADGRYVAFESEGSGSVNDPGRGGNAEDNDDVYVRDMVTGTLTLVSVTPAGVAGNADSDSPVISPDGHYVAFRSYATNLVNGVTSTHVQYYLRDLVNNTTTLLTVNPDGTPSDDKGFDAFPGFSFSADSRYLAFATYAALIPEDAHLDDDVYILDLQTHALTLAVSERGGIDTIASVLGSLSADGSYVAFDSQSTGLVPGDTNGASDIFLRQLQADAHLTLAPVTGDDHLAANEVSPAVPVSGTSDVIGGVVTVAVDGVQVATATVQSDGSWQTTFDARGLSGETVAITATVHDAIGFAASDGAMLVVDIVPPPLITAQTAAGIDLRWGTLYDELANSPIATGGSVTQYTAIDSGAFNGHTAAIKFVVTGTGFSYGGSSPNIQLTGGIITGIEEQDSSGNGLATFTGLSILATALQTALNTYVAGGATPVSSALNAIFLATTYRVTGGAGSDRLQGGNLDDTFGASTGNDTINGGAGSNTADYSGLTTPGLFAIVQGGIGTVNKGGANGTDTLTTGVQNIVDNGTGRSNGDVFEVDAAENVTGNSANFNYLIELSTAVNLVYGTNFTGISEFVADTGNNTVSFANDSQFAYVYGSTGNDTLTLGSGGGYLIGEGGSNTLNGGANATNLFIGGQGGTDTMNGGTGSASNYYFVDGNDQVNGAGAFNVVIALSSDVNLQVGSGLYHDVQEFVSNGGNNAVTVAAGDTDFKYLYGGTGNDTLTTGSGGGYLIGEGGTNVLTGGGGTNVFVADGGPGVDTMNGGSGSNIYFIDANSVVHGAGTFNTAIELQQNVSLALGSSQLGSDIQEVVLSGGTNTVDFHTATSQVFLYGSAGNDSLFGGTGSDFLYGAGGTNTFTFAAGWGKDTIEDWTTGTGDIIDLTGLSSLGVHAITDLTQTISGGKDVITSSHTGINSITLVGVGSALAASSFHFT